MKQLEFAIWVYREIGLRAFCLFWWASEQSGGLWSLALREQGPGFSKQQRQGRELSWQQDRREPLVCASPSTIIAGQLCLFRLVGSLDCYVKKKLTTMLTRVMSWAPVTALGLGCPQCSRWKAASGPAATLENGDAACASLGVARHRGQRHTGLGLGL